MRTTFTVDADLVPRLKALKKAHGQSMARVVNELLRAGLNAAPRRPKRFKLKTFRSKVLLENLDNVADILEVLEGTTRR
ncbi:MAG: hypothetical protein AB1938_27685 [Myxococcota bacterium]